MRVLLPALVGAFLFVSCSAGKGVPQTSDQKNALPAAATTSETDSRNNLLTVSETAPAHTDPDQSTSIVFEGSNNLFDLIDQNQAYFDKGHDMIVIKGDDNLIRLYNTSMLNLTGKDADTLVLVGHQVKYAMVSTPLETPGTIPATTDTIQLKAQPFQVHHYTEGLQENRKNYRRIQGLLEQIETGDLDAYHALGDVYLYGIDDTPISTGKAVALYEYGAVRGHTPSLQRLGDIWYNGTFDFKPNKAKATFYYKLGAQLKDAHCQQALQNIKAR